VRESVVAGILAMSREGRRRDKSSGSIDEDIDGEKKIQFVNEYYELTMSPWRVGSRVKSYMLCGITDEQPSHVNFYVVN
jgi:hypothetical protein